jgi:DNA-binding NtrC family response regulator
MLASRDVAETTVPHRVQAFPVRTLRVEVVRGPDQGRAATATSDILTVGTSPGNDVVLVDDTVSRYHLELRRTDQGILVEDCGSKNGTLTAGITISRATVPPGTVLNLGRTALRVDAGGTVDVDVFDADRLGPIRGRAPEMRRLMTQVERAAKSDVSVLLLGETGVGKEVFARAIHEASPRAGGPFETVDCGSLMPTLIASELFGHEKGAFTGADQRHVGAFERADGGTLFLDEVGELPAALQATLLGALERRSFRRVGGTKPINVDVRLVSATNRDLRGEVNQGSFRSDLYYRIAVVMFRIPALRERLDDVPLLIEHFAREAGWDGPIEGAFPRAVMEGLRAHRWPGNVRELRNFVEAALAMGEAPALDPRDRVTDPDAPAGASASAGGPVELKLANLDGPYRESREAVLRTFETQYLRRLLERTQGNVTAAAREAKMDRSYLMELLKKHEIERP